MHSRIALLAVLFCVGLGVVLLKPDLFVDPGPLIKGHEKTEGDCYQCHTLLLGPSSSKCIVCHKVEKIGVKKPKATRFHQHLKEQRCTACHTDHIGINAEKATRVFEHSLLTMAWRENCSDCHAKPGDALHRNVGKACQTCHTAVRWQPATFDHSRYFRFDGDHPAECKRCHIDNRYDRFTCYECHEHSPANVREEHIEEGIRNFENCAECHRSADEDEAERIWQQKSRKRGLDGRRGKDGDD